MTVDVQPTDQYNTQLIANVHPADWRNPTPASVYDLVVIGAGTAGLVSAAGAAGLGAKVALVEKHLLGGDCLNVGCVPSKAIIRSAHAMHDIQQAAAYGIANGNSNSNSDRAYQPDFAAVMERMRRLRAKISHNDSTHRFSDLGVDVFLGEGQFRGSHTLNVGDQTLHFKKAVIATGARAFRPPIPGLEEAGFLTNETVFSLTERPERIAVIGGGPIGCELAQAFRRLGSEVVLFHNTEHILNREDADAAEIVQQTFLREQICLILNAKITQVTLDNGKKVLHYERPGCSGEVAVDEILVGAGRVPNVDGLNLEVAGVEYDTRKGVVVNEYLQTTNSAIYAAGDICMEYKFTHAADAAARIVLRNALFMGRAKVTDLVMPWCTYTDPEIAHVGLYEHEAEKHGVQLDTFLVQMDDVDRAITDGDEHGFVKIHVKRGTDQLVGATIVARHAGDMISELTLAIVANVGLKTLATVIHPYPTQAEAIKKAADAYNRSRLTKTVKNLMATWIKWTT